MLQLNHVKAAEASSNRSEAGAVGSVGARVRSDVEGNWNLEGLPSLPVRKTCVETS